MSQNEDIKNVNTRRRNIMFLMQRFLQDNALTDTAKQLVMEANLSEDYELCDNVDLESIYLDFANYFHLRFGKYPRLLRKSKHITTKVSFSNKTEQRRKPQAVQKELNKMPTKPENAYVEQIPELEITVRKVETSTSCENFAEIAQKKPQELARLEEIEHVDFSSGTIDNLNNNSDWQTLSDLVKSTIFREDVNLSWSDIYGNAACIDTIKEAVLAPIKYPKLFINGLQPWRSVLLHGPPGSGKTLLARILYAETRNQVTFFNVSASVIVSKWRGESEKILRVLFHVARRQAPSIIFFDEIESLTSRRDRAADHESSKRFKNEFLQLLDGMEQQSNNIFILGSSNLPWEIDEAFLRRFEKKILVQLPNGVERAHLIGKLLPINIKLSEQEMQTLVELSENFTGDEIRLACKEIAMQTVRDILAIGKHNAESLPQTVETAFQKVKPLSLKLMPKHKQWQQEHGS